MNIAGKLSDSALKHIFAYISRENVSGSIYVSDGESERVIFIRPDSVKLYTMGKRKRVMIGEILILMGLIDEECLKNGLFIQKNTGMKLGNILIEQGSVTPQDLEKALRNVLFEEVYDILFWNSAGFNFVEQTQEHLFEDTDLRYLESRINMNEFLQEASAKIDEIDVLKQWVPDDTAVYIIRENIKKEDCLAKVPGYSCRMILDFLNGEHDVRSICGNMRISQYEVYRVLSILLSEGFVKELDAENILTKGDEYLSRKEGKKALDMFSTYVEMGGDRAAVLKKTALAKELLGNYKEAAVDYGEYAQKCYDDGDCEESFICFDKAVQLWPDNPDITFHYAELLKEQNRTEEWMQYIERTARICTNSGEKEKAVELYREILRHTPDSVRSKRELSKLLQGGLSAQEQQESVMCPVCEKKYPKGTDECTDCSQELTHACLSCGRSIAVSDSECPECGGNPHQSPESSEYVQRESSVADLDDGSKPDSENINTFWNNKIDIYTREAQESSKHLDFSSAKSKLETAMLINPENEKIRMEMDKVDTMAAKKEVADSIDRAMVAYYRQKWGRALRWYGKVLKYIDSSFPMYSDIYIHFSEVKRITRKRKLIIGTVAAAAVAALLSFYIPFELSRRRNRSVSERLTGIREQVNGSTASIYRKTFSDLEKMEKTYSEYPELAERVRSLHSELRAEYIGLARKGFEDALRRGKEKKYESGIKKLKQLKSDFPDISTAELPDTARIDPAIELFEKKIGERELFRKRRAKALEYLEDIRKKTAERKYREASETARVLESLLSDGKKLLNEGETETFGSLKEDITASIGKADALTDAISSLVRQGRFKQARATISETRKKFKDSDLSTLLDPLSADLEKAQTKSENDFVSAKLLFRKGSFARARTKLKELIDRHPDIDSRNNIMKLLNEISTYVSGAQETIREIKKYIKDRRIKKAYDATRIARTKYASPPVKEIQSLELPVYITSEPSSVSVSFSGNQGGMSTPMTVFIPEGGTKTMVFTKKGFLTKKSTVTDKKWSVTVVLEKTTQWPPLSIPSAISVLPVCFKNYVIITAETGVRAFDADTGKIAWRIHLYDSKKTIPDFNSRGKEIYVGQTDFWNITSRPLISKGKLVVGGRNGKLYFINPETGSIEKVLPDKSGETGYGCISGRVSIKEIPLLMNEEIVFFGNYDKHLYAVSASSGKLKWRAPMGEENTAPLLLCGGKVWIGLRSGKLGVWGTADGYSVTFDAIDSKPLMECVKLQNTVLVSSQGGKLVSMNENAEPVWEKALDETITATPLFRKGRIYCPLANKLFCVINSHTGGILWTSEIEDSASCTPLIAHGNIYTGSFRNIVYCIDELSRELKWKYKIEGSPFSMHSTGDNLVVITRNGKIYTFSVEA